MWAEFCHFLTPHPLLRRQFLYPECGQKQTFFEPLPPHLVHVVIERPLMRYPQNQKPHKARTLCKGIFKREVDLLRGILNTYVCIQKGG